MLGLGAFGGMIMFITFFIFDNCLSMFVMFDSMLSW